MNILRPSKPPSSLIRILQCSRANEFLALQSLHTSASKPATPVPFPVAPGPPPKPPVPDASFAEDRVARKKRQAELVKLGQTLRASSTAKPALPLQKRFWRHVTVHETPDGLQIWLDTRPVRTPSKHVLTIPHNKHQLATAIALEWDLLVSAQQATKHHYIPLTSLTSRAIHIRQADLAGNTKIREDLVRMVMGYLNTDTLLCWAPEKNIHDNIGLEHRSEKAQTLRDMQMLVAQPIISHLTSRVWPGVELNPVLEENSIIPTRQPEMTTQVIKGWVSGLSPFELAGLERAVLATKSLLVAVRLLVDWSQEFSGLCDTQDAGQKFTIEDAAEACNLEVIWQTRMWGEVEDTHDVNREDLRRQLGSVIVLVHGDSR